ncbi:MAG: TldD/PmbA family protein [Planctomycetota bacterium]|jgi:TldD protein
MIALAEEDLRRILSRGLSRGGDFAELFLEERQSSRHQWQEGRLASTSSGNVVGAGIRVVAGDRTGYASTTEATMEALLETARRASDIATEGGAPPPITLGPRDAAPASPLPEGGSEALPLLEAAERRARAEGEVCEVGIYLADSSRNFVVANSLGVYAEETQRHSMMLVSTLARRQGVHRPGRAVRSASGEGASLTVEAARSLGREAAGKALRMLDAREVPPGPLPVVFAPGDGAILFHEAVGHSLEADIVQSGNSIFESRLGEPVAASGVTLLDDATPPGLGGSFRTDDEGSSGRKTVLIEDGRLAGFLHDRRSASKAGIEPTGNGRRQDFRFVPIPRMTNTYILEGEEDPGEILASVERGLYVRGVGAGQSNTNSGGFTFEVLDADWIEKGKIVHPVCNASLVGDAFSVLMKMDRIGRDFAFGKSGGMCGKGQLVPVEGGMPTVRVKDLTVGGRGG